MVDREVSSPITFVPPLFNLPLLKFYSFPRKTLPLFQPLSYSKKLFPHSQYCSKTHIFEKRWKSEKETDTNMKKDRSQRSKKTQMN